MKFDALCRFATLRPNLVTVTWLAAALGCGGGTEDPGGPGTPAVQIPKTSGDDQAVVANQQLPQPLAVTVTQSGAPVASKTVTWQVTAGGGSVNPSASTTNAQGVATTSVTVGILPTMTISATADGATAPVVFTALIAAPAATIELTSGNTVSPSKVAITAGGQVTFNWTGINHNVTPDGGKDRPSFTNHDTPYTGVVQFPTPGTYQFHCTNHAGMTGTIVVL